MADESLQSLVRNLHRLAGAEPTGGPTDQELLEAFCATKDSASFAALVQRHGAMVLRVCRGVLGHEQDAEDAFQATFLVLAGHAAGICKRGSLASWLHGVAHRTALSARRDAGRRRTHERRADTPRTPDPAREVTWREVQAALDEEVGRLPEKYLAASRPAGPTWYFCVSRRGSRPTPTRSACSTRPCCSEPRPIGPAAARGWRPAQGRGPVWRS
jgi:Sigma-70 region 2